MHADSRRLLTERQGFAGQWQDEILPRAAMRQNLGTRGALICLKSRPGLWFPRCTDPGVIAAACELANTVMSTPPPGGAAAASPPGAAPRGTLAGSFWSFLDNCFEPDCLVPLTETDRRPAADGKREREGQTAPALAVPVAPPASPLLAWGLPVPDAPASNTVSVLADGQAAANPPHLSTDSGPNPASSPDALSGNAPAAAELAFAARLRTPDPAPPASTAGVSRDEPTRLQAPADAKASTAPQENRTAALPEMPESATAGPLAAVAARIAPRATQENRSARDEPVRAGQPDPKVDSSAPLPAVPSRDVSPAHASEARESSAPRPAEPEPPLPTPAPRDVSLRLADGQRSVDIRMAERAGEIHVMVHTPDRDLANSLRGDLPDLVGKLRQSGFQAETWRPAPAQQADSGRWSGADDFSGSSHQHSAGHPRDGRQQQQQQDQPRWAGEWNTSLDPAQETSR